MPAPKIQEHPGFSSEKNRRDEEVEARLSISLVRERGRQHSLWSGRKIRSSIEGGEEGFFLHDRPLVEHKNISFA